MSRLPTILLVAMSLSGCPAAPARTGVPDAGSMANASDALAADICVLAMRCTSGQAVTEPIPCSSVAMNVSGQNLRPDALTSLQNGPSSNSFDTFVAVQDSIEAGRVTVDAGALARCGRAIRALSCNAVPDRFTQLSECAEVFRGTVAQGERCITTPACVAGHICVMPDQNPVPCEGTCQPTGTVCRDDGDCDYSHSCSGGLCKPAVKPAGAENQPCGSSFNLFTDTRCQDGLVCSTFGPDGICIKPGEEGATCWDRRNCATDFDCVVNGSEGTCRVEHSVGEGDRCVSYNPLCGPGLRCVDGRAGGTCVRLKGLGEPCEFVAECGRPESGLICHASQHICVTEPDSGPCPAPGVSPVGGCNPRVSYCRDSDNTCVPFKALGDTCRGGDECGEPVLGTYCNPLVNGNTCAPWPTSQRCLP